MPDSPNVLIALSGYEASFDALRFAVQTYQYHGDNAHLYVVHVTDDEGDETAQQLLADAEQIIETSDYTGPYDTILEQRESLISSNAQTGELINALCDMYDIDHVFMGNVEKSLTSRLILGSATDKVISAADTTVTLVPDEYGAQYHTDLSNDH